MSESIIVGIIVGIIVILGVNWLYSRFCEEPKEKR